MTRREKERGEQSERSSWCRRRTIEREAEYDRGRGDRRGTAATIEREPTGATAAVVEREREEREDCSLARQSVPTTAQHTSTFSRLSFPFFTAVSPNHHAALRAALSYLFLSPRVLLLFRSPSRRFSLRLARRPSPLSSYSPLLLVRFLSLFLRRLAFLHVQDVAAISERGRVYIHAY